MLNIFNNRNNYSCSLLSWQVAVFVGITLRLLLFSLDDSLWRDEAKFLMALLSVSVDDLFAELPFGQRSPFALGLFWKSMTENTVAGTHLVRLPSLLIGIAQLLVITSISKRLFKLNTIYSKLIIWLTAVSPSLILYSNQAKPYIFDVFFSTLLTLIALPFFLSKNQNRRQASALVLISCVSLFFSYPASFVVVSICFGILFTYGLIRWRLLLTISFGSSVCILFIYLASGESSTYMYDYWIYAFPKPEIRWWIHALIKSVFVGFRSPNYLDYYVLFLFFGWLFIPLCAFGVYSLCRKKIYGLLCLLLFPSLICLAASLFHKYPFSDRLILFMSPLVTILLVLGLHFISSLYNSDKSNSIDFTAFNDRIKSTSSSKKRLEKISQSGLWIFIIISLIISFIEYSYPLKGVKSGIDYIVLHEEQGDIIVADLYAAQVVKYYRTVAAKQKKRNFPQAEIIFPWPDETDKNYQKSIRGEEKDKLLSKSRIWVIAESEGFHRVLESKNLKMTRKLISSLENSHNKIYDLKIPRLRLVCFSVKNYQKKWDISANQH